MVYTKELLEAMIEGSQKEIERKEEELKQYKEKLAALEEYHKLPIEERTLERYVSERTKTVSIMDEFERITEEGFRKYDRMIIKSYFWVPEVGICHMILERMPRKQEYVGDITMTDFKKNNSDELCNYIYNEIKYQRKKKEYKKGDYVPFRKPYLLRAQNSKNRTGYGNEYNGYDMVYQGTLYGETTNYAFTGFILGDYRYFAKK